ncbi:hypothetical protein GWI33_017710 [Rhynchophorus ferrugineus]|uniref:Uncharacterized protein n=1 Tax=Rhynchophorus ferrugineus TaxID=354439 RepID=A0A834HXN5_RHYFE|nr:hypothetical protein GWI33_017710 [Rhynchophorus ferrugineus]
MAISYLVGAARKQSPTYLRRDLISLLLQRHEISRKDRYGTGPAPTLICIGSNVDPPKFYGPRRERGYAEICRLIWKYNMSGEKYLYRC